MQNNAATSLVNPVVIPVFKQLQICISISICVSVSLILNSFFYNTTLSDKKVSLCDLLFKIRPEYQSASLP